MDREYLLQTWRAINTEYAASIARGPTPAYLEGAQIGRMKMSLEMCQYTEGSPECIDWQRGYFMELGKR